jgi:hypothetical protein
MVLAFVAVFRFRCTLPLAVVCTVFQAIWIGVAKLKLEELNVPQGEVFVPVRIMLVMVVVVACTLLKQWNSERMEMKLFRWVRTYNLI